ncbi:MAG: hypothetical protein M1489_03735 [Firmicutes bacterium]|nr:hypothetical protein [Bacillota bacterium]
MVKFQKCLLRNVLRGGAVPQKAGKTAADRLVIPVVKLTKYIWFLLRLPAAFDKVLPHPRALKGVFINYNTTGKVFVTVYKSIFNLRPHRHGL